MHRAALPLLIGALLCACDRTPAAAPSAAPVAAPASPTAAPPEPASTPVDAEPRPRNTADEHLPDHRILKSAPWPGAGDFDDAIAVVAERTRSGRAERVLTWYRESERAPAPDQRSHPADGLEVTGMVARDVDADGRSDLVVFVSAGSELGTTLAVFDLAPASDQPLEKPQPTAALDGAKTAADLDRLLPLARGLPKEDLAQASRTALLGRLSYASIEQLREVVGAKGLELCQVQAVNYQNPKQSCRRIPRGKLGPKDHAAIVATLTHTFSPYQILAYECTPEACIVGQPSGYSKSFDFSGTGPDAKLVRITESDMGIGE